MEPHSHSRKGGNPSVLAKTSTPKARNRFIGVTLSAVEGCLPTVKRHASTPLGMRLVCFSKSPLESRFRGVLLIRTPKEHTPSRLRRDTPLERGRKTVAHPAPAGLWDH